MDVETSLVLGAARSTAVAYRRLPLFFVKTNCLCPLFQQSGTENSSISGFIVVHASGLSVKVMSYPFFDIDTKFLREIGTLLVCQGIFPLERMEVVRA